MKNYKVKATRFFVDKEEKVERKVNDEFVCTQERYEYLKANNAVELVEVIEEQKDDETDETDAEVIEEKEEIEPIENRVSGKFERNYKNRK